MFYEITRAELRGVYTASAYLDFASDRFVGPILVCRTDNRPSEATVPWGRDSVPCTILYPSYSAEGEFKGKKSTYTARPGEIVLYRYGDDSFSTIGWLKSDQDHKRQSKALMELMQKQIEANQSPQTTPVSAPR